MALGYFGFYEDAAKIATIIVSGGNFATTAKRKDWRLGGYFRLTDGTLITFSEIDKYEEILTLNEVSEDDKTTLKTEYDKHQSFFYYPDVENRAAEVYEVKWVGTWNEVYNKRTKLYMIIINLKEV